MPTAEQVRADFPILAQKVHGKPLAYLDNAATTQKPRQVIDAMRAYYEGYNANVHRSIHTLGERATAAWEQAHHRLGAFVGAGSFREIVFTKNSTEAINIVAHAWAGRLKPGDEVAVTLLEHHSNFVPWQQMCRRTGATLRVIPITPEGRVDMAAAERIINAQTRVLAVSAMSNVLGTQPDVRALARLAHAHGAVVLADGSQSVPHRPTRVRDLECDFLVFSGHKMLGPTGIGVLWGREEVLDKTEPLLYGGEMIKRVTLEESRFNDLPWRFEAGTPNIAEGIGLMAAADYLDALGMDWVQRTTHEITAYAMKRIADVPGVRIFGPPASERGSVVAFEMEGIHPHDLATLLDQDGVAIRAGHHCAQPLMQFLEVPSTARASFYIYSLREEVDALATGLEKARKVFGLA